MTEQNNNLYEQDYFDYLKNRGRLRKFIRRIYLKDIRKYCTGKTIDLGCGIGELLRKLPPGSIGFEVNPVAVDFCNKSGLEVCLYDPASDDYKFHMLRENVYDSFTMNHVLEHLDKPERAIHNIFESCHRLGVKRIIFTVPGKKGYQSDPTHRTFINTDYFSFHGLLNDKYYRLVRKKYFPVNWSFFSSFFQHNELRLIFERNNG